MKSIGLFGADAADVVIDYSVFNTRDECCEYNEEVAHVTAIVRATADASPVEMMHNGQSDSPQIRCLVIQVIDKYCRTKTVQSSFEIEPHFFRSD